MHPNPRGDTASPLVPSVRCFNYSSPWPVKPCLLGVRKRTIDSPQESGGRVFRLFAGQPHIHNGLAACLHDDVGRVRLITGQDHLDSVMAGG